MTIEDTSNECACKDFAACLITAKAKAKTRKVTCGCPGSECGKKNISPLAHVFVCWIKKKLLTKRFAIDTFVILSKWNDGYRLGIRVYDVI
jgi:hypothetical protein